MAKFTFKKDAPATGLASMLDYGSGEIKLDGKICGFYQGKSYDRFEVWFSVKDDAMQCGWRNVKLKKEFPGEPELRAWVKEHTEDICKVLELHFRGE